MRRYGAPHRVIVSSLNCQSGLKHALVIVLVETHGKIEGKADPLKDLLCPT